jgi:hypothetical protein
MRRRTAIVLAVLLAALAGLVWLLTEFRDAPPTAPEETVEAPEAAGPSDSEPTGSRPPAPSRPAPGPRPAVQEEDDPPGELRLEGQVLEPGDLPVGGARVTVNTRPERAAVTEPDGSFAFEGLLPKRYVLTAREGARVGGPVAHRLSDRSDPVIVRLRAGLSLEVRVRATDPDGPLPGASVSLRGQDQRHETADPEGVARFRGVEAGGVVVAAEAPGFAPGRRLVIVPEASERPIQVRLALSRGFAVQGRVLTQDDQPVAEARVLAEPMGGLFDLHDPELDSVASGPDGRFAFPALAPGSYRFSGSHPNHPPGESGAVRVEPGRPTPEVRIRLQPGGRLSGRVVDEGGAGVPHAQVRVSAAAASPYRRTFGGTRVRQAVCDAQGAFRFQGLPRTQLSLVAQAESASSDVLPADLSQRPEIAELELRLVLRGRITGTVVTAAGEPVPEAEVSATSDLWAGEKMEELELRGRATAQTDGAGAFVLAGLPEGAAFRLRASRSGLGMRELLQPGVPARTGDEGVRLVLASPGALVGQVRAADGGPVLRFSVLVDFPPGQPVEDEQGRFRIEGVPAGSHQVRVRGEGLLEAVRSKVEVRADQDTDLGVILLPRGRRVSGRVLDGADAPVAGADVVSALQLVGDGTNLTLELGAALDEQLDVRRTASGADGGFVLEGVSPEPRLVVAEAGPRGRSEAVELAPGTEDTHVTLRLRAFGSLIGRITQGGKPAAGAMVSVSPKGVAGQSSLVRTGEDGGFRVEKLPAGEHHVHAGIASEGGLGGSSGSAEVVVRAGEESRVEIDVPAGEVTLRVTIQGKDGAALDLAQALLLPGQRSFEFAAEINKAVQSLGTGLKSGFWMPGQTLRLTQVVPGTYSLCVIPINGNMNDPVFMQKLQKSTASLRVYCQPVVVSPAPAEQSVTAIVPPMDPLPPDPEPSP